MGGFFGCVSNKDCVNDLFYGIDYHSHLGTRRAGMAMVGPDGFRREPEVLSTVEAATVPFTREMGPVAKRMTAPSSFLRKACSLAT